MLHLYFVRHGESTANLRGKINGSSDSLLTIKGEEQAKQAGQIAQKLELDCIISSPLKRALATAAIIAKEINYPIEKIRVSQLVTERDFGAMEGQPWSPNMKLDSISNVESKEAIIRRAREIIKVIDDLRVANILIVSHGSFGRALRQVTDSSQPFDFPQGFVNGEIVRFI